MRHIQYIGLLAPLTLLTAAAAPTRITVAPFDSIKLQGGDTIELVRGPTEVVVTRADPETLAQLRVETVADELFVGRKRDACRQFACRGTASLRIATPNLSAMTVQGSGTLHGEGVTGRTLAITVMGSGEVRLGRLDAHQTKVEIDGTGGVEVKGRSQNLSTVTNGGGTLDATGLIAQDVMVQANGGGSVRAHATGTASIKAVGSQGSIRIDGTRHCQITRVGHADIACGTGA